MNQSKCEYLFDLLTQYAVKEQGILDVVSEGIGLRQMQQLLAQFDGYLEGCFQIPSLPEIHIHQPWRTKVSQHETLFNKAVIAFLSRKRTAIIVGIEHPAGHWSVLRANGNKGVCFFDSDGLSGPIKNRFKISRKIPATWQQQVDLPLMASPQGVFFLAIR